jgi:hypothetical protein
MRILLTFLTLLTYSLSFGQIEIKVQKIRPDSISIEFPKDMQIKVGREYEFVYKTNVQLSDSLRESLSNEILYDGLKVKKTFDHCERGINITSKIKNEVKNTYDVGQNIFYINGTNKWKVKIDGKYISRYISNDIKPNSVIEIEIQSDNYDLSKAKYQEPVVFFWLANHSSFEKFEFNGKKITVDLSKYPDFINGLNKNEKHNAVVILLPQVKVKRKKLFSDEQKKRMYIMRYVE